MYTLSVVSLQLLKRDVKWALSEIFERNSSKSSQPVIDLGAVTSMNVFVNLSCSFKNYFMFKIVCVMCLVCVYVCV